MSEGRPLSPTERGEPQNILERGQPAAVLKSMKQLKKEQRARANIFDLNGVESERQVYRGELVKLLIILLVLMYGGSWLFRWLMDYLSTL